MEQAGFDRNLFENGGNKHRFVDVTYPEFVIPSCPYSSMMSNREERSHIQQLLIKETGPFNPTLPETTRLAILPTWNTLSSTSDKSTSRRRSGKRRSWPPRSRNEGMYIRTWTGTHEFISHSVRDYCRFATAYLSCVDGAVTSPFQKASVLDDPNTDDCGRTYSRTMMPSVRLRSRWLLSQLTWI